MKDLVFVALLIVFAMMATRCGGAVEPQDSAPQFCNVPPVGMMGIALRGACGDERVTCACPDGCTVAGIPGTCEASP